MYSISRTALYTRILFSSYLLWEDSLFSNGTQVINASQQKGFRLLLPSVPHFHVSGEPVCLCWTIGRGGFSDAGSEKGRTTLPPERRMESGKDWEGRRLSQSGWHRAGVGWEGKGQTRDGEKVKTLQKGLRVWTWTYLKAASLQNGTLGSEF